MNYIAMDDQRSTSLIKGVGCGALAPGVTVLKKLFLTNTGAPGERVVDISVQSQSRDPQSSSPASPSASVPTSPVVASPTSPIPAEPTSPSAAPIVDRTETLRTLSIGAIRPLTVAHETVYKRPTRPQPGLADLKTFEGGARDEGAAVEAHVTSTITVAAPAGIAIESVVLKRSEKAGEGEGWAEIVDCSIDKDDLAGGKCELMF